MKSLSNFLRTHRGLVACVLLAHSAVVLLVMLSSENLT